MKLSDLKPGEKAVVVKVSGYGGFRKRIIEMGFIGGKIVESILNAPFKEPTKYRIMGYEVSLRRSEASQIEVMSIEEANLIAKQHPKESFNGTFTEENIRRIALKKRKTINVALVGNPNSGKTSLFNVASGRKERVGNYSGVTVEEKKGVFDAEGYHFNIVDLPGTYSLTAYSPEERYVRNHIVTEKPDIIINVVDTSNLERNLYLTTQLIDMNVRMVIALNMYDELKENGDVLDYKTFEKLIGVPVVPTVSTKRTGIDELFRTVIKLYESGDIIDDDGNLIPTISDDTLIDEYLHTINIHHKHEIPNIDSDLKTENHIHATVRHIHINHGAIIEEAIEAIKTQIAQNSNARDEYTPRYQAIKLLEEDKEIEEFITQYPNATQIISTRDKVKLKISSELKDSPENAIADAKYGFIAGALKETFTPSSKEGKQKLRSSKIDNVVTHKWFGFPIFFTIIALMFCVTFLLGKYPEDLIEWVLECGKEGVEHLLENGMLKDLINEGIIDGCGAVIVFLPYILILYFFITFIESTGYMARAAFIMDKVLHKIGLHGQSFIPLFMGFGCNMPAILATRTIKNPNSRLMTILILPFMSCSVRGALYVLLAGAFFSPPYKAALAVVFIYLTGITIAVVTARICKRFLFLKDETPFVMELPPYRLPTLKSLWRHTWEKGEHFLRKIASVVLIGTIVIWALGYFPRHEQALEGKPMTFEMKKEQRKNSILGKAGAAMQTITSPLGFDDKMSIAILSGLAAKEMVPGTLGILYEVENDMEETKGEKEFQTKLRSGIDANIAEKLKKEKVDAKDIAQKKVMENNAISLSFLLFILIYFPCIATIGTIKKETASWKWAFFVIVYTLVLAWLVSFAAYNIFSHFTIPTVIIFAVLTIAVFFAGRSIYKSLKRKNCCSCKGCSNSKTCSE
ncbi:MAG: ferrous iron transport protein B [Bacteroidales bacterium]|jgi:ferrous iron transport protein B|nr:ferrous iron transport protein B [Bacteroidales bacterium]